MNTPLNRTVMWLTWRQLFAQRRLWLAAAFSLVPLLVTVFYRFTVDDREGATLTFFTGLNANLIIGILVPIAAAVFGTTAFGGEVDDGTLVYLLIKPVARWSVLLSKYVVATACTIAVMVPGMALPWLLLRGSEVSDSAFVGFAVAGAAASATYCAIFLVLGLASKRALVFALLYIIAFETVASRNIVGLKSLSVREFAVAISQAASSGAIAPDGYVVPITTAYVMTAVFIVVALVVGLRKLVRYEVAERV